MIQWYYNINKFLYITSSPGRYKCVLCRYIIGRLFQIAENKGNDDDISAGIGCLRQIIIIFTVSTCHNKSSSNVCFGFKSCSWVFLLFNSIQPEENRFCLPQCELGWLLSDIEHRFAWFLIASIKVDEDWNLIVIDSLNLAFQMALPFIFEVLNF